MRLPALPQKSVNREMVDTFRGYNHNLRISDGEFFDMKNMTSDYYPVLSPRGQRGVYVQTTSPQGIIAKNEVCYVDGADFVIGQQRISMGLSVQESMCPKQLTSMGAYVIIMPDKMYINTADPKDFGKIEAHFTSADDVTFQLCGADGGDMSGYAASTDAPNDPANMDYWLDTASTPNVLKQYAATSASWVTVASTYVKISSTGIGREFRQYDGVTISGVLDESLKDLNANMIVFACGDDYIVVSGIMNGIITQSEAVSVSRVMPNMDFLTESNNRLWGCRYGEAVNGEMVNEIYACKLGDFRNWNCFMGISTDSYTASCGTDGPFTGAITHLGYPLFFKENCVHKVYGTYPANYQIQDTVCRGVQRGCAKSLAIVNETLFYKARNCVCAFDGSLPTEVSYALAGETYCEAVGGAIGNKYYVSMMDLKGSWHLFVYDMIKKMWHKEDSLHADVFCAHQGELYCIDHDSKEIITMFGSGTKDESPVEWMVQTGELGISSPDMKFVSRMILRMSAEIGTVINVYAQYDTDMEWVHLCNITSTGLRSFSVPIRPRRCDHMRLRIEGVGAAKIYSHTRTITQGSDRS